MNQISLFLALLLNLTVIVNAVPPIFIAGDKYFKTGVFQVTSTPFSTGIISSNYNVNFYGCALSSDAYQVGMGLFSLDIKFNGLVIMYDLEIQSTSVTGFEVKFSSDMANLISLLKVCYIIKNPSYPDVFQIINYRYVGSSFIITFGGTIYTKQITLAEALPVSSLGSMKERTFLYSFNLQSKAGVAQDNLDIYPSSTILNVNTLELKLQTLYDDVKIYFYAFTIVIFDQVQVTASGLSRFNLNLVQNSVSGSSLFIDTTPLRMLPYNTYVGLKAFHARTLQNPNFVNFVTSFPTETRVRFQSLNVVNWKYMRFQILVIESASCPLGYPYFIYNTRECLANLPYGYAVNCEGNAIIDFQINLKSIIKNPQKNQVEVTFDLFPDDIQSKVMYSQTDWNNAVSIDIPGNKNIEYSPFPEPQLKMTIDYIHDLQQLQKTITIQAYDKNIYPTRFDGFAQKKVPIKFTASNNLLLKLNNDSTFKKTSNLSYVFIVLSIIYMILFFIGFLVGKIYILEMAFVPQVTFLSVVSLENVSTTMTSLSYLKYVFGFWYEGNDQTIFVQQEKNYMKLMGISGDFLLNYNIMFILIIITYILGAVFHHKNKPRAKRFFLLDTPMYLALWFGLWILFTGQIQIRSLATQQGQTALGFCGLVVFLFLLIHFFVYFGIYFKKIREIDSFYTIFIKRQEKKDENWRQKYFYLVLFFERFLLSILFAHAYMFDYLNILIMLVSIGIIALVMVFRPYKFRLRPYLSRQKTTLFRPNLRQILNYLILIFILLFLLITNQIYQSEFRLNVPIIIVLLLFVNIILTIFFLIFDGKLKQDYEELKKLFDPLQQQPLEKQPVVQAPYQRPKSTERKINQDNVFVGFVDSPTPKDTLLYKKYNFDRSFQVEVNPKAYKNQNQNQNYNDLRKYHEQKQQQNFSIDEQLMKVAERNQQLYRRGFKQGSMDPQSPHQQVPKIKSYHSIMKGANGKKGLSYEKHNKYFIDPQQI